MAILERLLSTLHQKWLPHTRLPSVFMSKTPSKLDDKPLDFSGPQYRIGGAPGFTDDRMRDEASIVPYAPRKIMPDLVGGGIPVSEDYPYDKAQAMNPGAIEANVPRLARGEKCDTLTGFHDADMRTFDIAVANFRDTPDVPPLLKELKEKLEMRAALGFEEMEDQDDFTEEDFEKPAWDGAANPTMTQPETPYNAKYPYNHVRETESGHLFESDDTPGSERIKESHRSGTYYEIFPDGTKVEKIVRERFTVVVSNDKVNIQGSAIVTVEGDCNFYTKGNFTQQVDGDYSLLVKGKHTVQVADDTTLECHANYFHKVGFPIDKAKGALLPAEGRGNKGGSAWIKVAGDRTTIISGNELITIGDSPTFDVDGNVIAGYDKDAPSEPGKGNPTASNRTLMVFGNQTATAMESKKDVILKNVTEIIKGDRKSTVGKKNIFRSTEGTEIAGLTIELNPPTKIDADDTGTAT